MTQTQTDTSPSHPQQFSLSKRMLAGATLGLFLIALFLFSAPEADPAWGKLWMIRPLIFVPLAGAMGGLFNYLIMHFHNQLGINKAVAIIVSVFVFIIGLWLGTILGLDGTWWD